MKKREKVFFVFTVIFLAVVVAFAAVTAVFVTAYLSARAGNSDLGEAIGGVICAILGILGAVAAGVAAVCGSVFAALNLRTDVRWLKTVSLVALIVDATVAIAAVIFLVLLGSF